MEVPRLRVKLELQLPASTTATTMPVPSHVRDLHSTAHRNTRFPAPPTPNLLSEARDSTLILMDTSGIHFCCTTVGIPRCNILSTLWKGPLGEGIKPPTKNQYQLASHEIGPRQRNYNLQPQSRLQVTAVPTDL